MFLSIGGRSVHLGRSEFLVSQTKEDKEKKLNYQKRSFNEEQVWNGTFVPVHQNQHLYNISLY